MIYRLYYNTRKIHESTNLWEVMERINEPEVSGPVQLQWESRTDEAGTYDVALFRNWILLRTKD